MVAAEAGDSASAMSALPPADEMRRAEMGFELRNKLAHLISAFPQGSPSRGKALLFGGCGERFKSFELLHCLLFKDQLSEICILVPYSMNDLLSLQA
jgi:hypothetical protein